jgi:hypothetical protein
VIRVVSLDVIPSPNNSSDPHKRGLGGGLADYGHIAYVTIDGGHTAIAYHRPASDEIIRPARVVRAQSTQKGPHDECRLTARQRTGPSLVHAADTTANERLSTDKSRSWPPPSAPSEPAPSAAARHTAPPT